VARTTPLALEIEREAETVPAQDKLRREVKARPPVIRKAAAST
jgi:hypothetical protein